MNHSDLRELLPWYLNSTTLAWEERKAVKTHLKECRDCRAELDEIRSLRDDVKAFGESTPEPSSAARELGLDSILGDRGPRRVLTPALVTPWALALLFLGLSTHLWMRIANLEAPRSIPSVVLSQSRSEASPIELRESDRAFVVEIDINDPRPFLRYSCEILNEGGSKLASFHEEGPRRTLSLLLSSSGLPVGQRLILVVGGHMKEGDSPEVLGRYNFLLEQN